MPCAAGCSGPRALVVTLLATVGACLLALTAGCGGGGGDGPPGPAGPARFVYASAYQETSPGSGTFTGGIYAYAFDPASGALSAVPGSPFAPETQGAAVVMSRDAKYLYVSYSTSGAPAGTLSGYRIEPDGSLVSVPGSPYATLPGVSTPVANPTADFLYTTSVASTAPFALLLTVYAIDPSTGALSIQLSAPYSGDALAGPPLITPDGKYAYAVSQDVAEFSVDPASGALTELPGSPAMLNFDAAFSPSDAAIDPSSQFIYITNGAVFTGFGGSAYGLGIDQNGTTSIVWNGSPTAGPQDGVVVDSSGKYVIMSTEATSKTSSKNCLAVLALDASSGALEQVPGSPFPGSGASGSCGVLLADPSGTYLYEGSLDSITVYWLDEASGIPHAVTGSALPGMSVSSLAVTH